MARNADRFMERMHERRTERQEEGPSARALRRAQEAEQRRAQERAEREAQREAERATGFHSGGTVTGRLSGMDRAIRYAQMYSAGPEVMGRISANEINSRGIITAETVDDIRRGIITRMNDDIMQRLGDVYSIDIGRDPNAGLSLTEEDRVYHRERRRIIGELMDARYMRGHSNMSFEDTMVRLARELVALEDDHVRAEAQKQRRSALNIERRLGLDDFETGCKGDTHDQQTT